MIISIIAALDKNWLIGNKGKIPWHIREDFRRFYKLTVGKPVIMGRSTFESILKSLGKPLPKRMNIILTRNRNLAVKFPSLEKRGKESYCPFETSTCYANSIEVVLKIAKDLKTSELMVIGGASIYKQFLPLANKMYLTWIDHEFKGDTYFPKFDLNEWKVVVEEKNVESGYRVRFQVLEKLSFLRQ